MQPLFRTVFTKHSKRGLGYIISLATVARFCSFFIDPISFWNNWSMHRLINQELY